MVLHKSHKSNKVQQEKERRDKFTAKKLASLEKLKKLIFLAHEGNIDARVALCPHNKHKTDSLSRMIPLSQEQFAIVDADKYEWLMHWKWCAAWSPTSRSYYAKRIEKLPNGVLRGISMHRQILGLEYGDPRIGDHALHNTLDNRLFIEGKENLRIATVNENRRNTRIRKDNKTGYKGVQKYRENAYRATITIDGKQYYLGIRKTAKSAYLELFVPAAKLFHGKFAHLGTEEMQITHQAGPYEISKK